MLPEDSEISASEYDELFRRIDVDNSAGVSFEEVRSIRSSRGQCISTLF